MKNKELTKLKILIDILKSNYYEYYKKNIGHDFLDCVDECSSSDSISYLMEHIEKLNKKDKQYEGYLKHCYAIYVEFQNLVRSELESANNNYIALIQRNIIKNSVEISLLFESAIYDSVKMKEFCNEIKNDKEEILSQVVLNIVKEYKHFKENKTNTLLNLNSHSNEFKKQFDKLKKNKKS